MSLVLFNSVPTGAIETLFDDQPWFKGADLGRYLGIFDIARNFKDVKATPRLEIMKQCQPLPLGKRKNSHDALVNVGCALEIVVRSNKPKAVALVKWLGKKGVEKLQEEHQHDIKEHQRTITERDNVIEEKDSVIALLNDN